MSVNIKQACTDADLAIVCLGTGGMAILKKSNQMYILVLSMDTCIQAIFLSMRIMTDRISTFLEISCSSYKMQPIRQQVSVINSLNFL